MKTFLLRFARAVQMIPFRVGDGSLAVSPGHHYSLIGAERCWNRSNGPTTVHLPAEVPPVDDSGQPWSINNEGILGPFRVSLWPL